MEKVAHDDKRFMSLLSRPSDGERQARGTHIEMPPLRTTRHNAGFVRSEHVRNAASASPYAGRICRRVREEAMPRLR